MKIVNYMDFSPLKDIVEERAKYQKVMVLYDDSTSNTTLSKIYQLLKEDCVFNSIEIGKDLTEIYNGYRLLVFLCRTDNFLKLDIRFDEFINVFVPADDGMLPYYLNNQNKVDNKNCYLFLRFGVADPNILPSIYFNNFYNYLYQLVYCQVSDVKFNFHDLDITQLTLKNLLSNFDKKIEFVDIDILKKSNLTYNFLPLIDYVLICAFNCYILSVKERMLSLVDIYKTVGEDYELLDKYYAIISNKLLLNIVQLNSHCLITTAEKTKQKILDNIQSFSSQQVQQAIQAVKNYAKSTDGILTSLYLYNVFDL